jgi:hypothetical protein
MPTRAHAGGNRAPAWLGSRPLACASTPPDVQRDRDGDAGEDSAERVQGVHPGGVRERRDGDRLGRVPCPGPLARAPVSSAGGDGRAGRSRRDRGSRRSPRQYGVRLGRCADRREHPAAGRGQAHLGAFETARPRHPAHAHKSCPGCAARELNEACWKEVPGSFWTTPAQVSQPARIPAKGRRSRERVHGRGPTRARSPGGGFPATASAGRVRIRALTWRAPGASCRGPG